jgi:hypothetical protein
MLTISQDIVILILAVSASLLFMVALNHLWPPIVRHAQNDLIGWQLSILGTTYAVILGFMLYTVWTNFGAAEVNANLEASALRNLYLLSRALPDPQHRQMQTLCSSYARSVIDHDWPEMANAEIPDETREMNLDLWTTLMSVKPTSMAENLAEDHAISELNSLTDHRRTRILQSQDRVPTVLWFVLIVGAIVTIASCSLFGATSILLHSIQVFFFSLLITLVLLAIADINRPFMGSVHISNYAFQRALEYMHD